MTTGILTVLEEAGYPAGDGTPEDAIRRLARGRAELRDEIPAQSPDPAVSDGDWCEMSAVQRLRCLRHRLSVALKHRENEWERFEMMRGLRDQAVSARDEALATMERLTQQSIALGNENDAAHSYLDAAGVPKHDGLLERASLTTRLGWLESTLEILIKTRLAHEHSSQVATTAMSDQALRSAVAERLLNDPTGDERAVLAARLLLEGAGR